MTSWKKKGNPNGLRNLKMPLKNLNKNLWWHLFSNMLSSTKSSSYQWTVHTFPLDMYLVKCMRGRKFLSVMTVKHFRTMNWEWHLTDKEWLGLVEGVQHFQHYLVDNKFTVFTDNVSCKYLQYIKSIKTVRVHLGWAYSFMATKSGSM